MNFEKLIVDSIDSVVAVNKTTGELMLMLDQIKDGTMENANDTVYMTGKQGVQLAALDRNKTSTFTCNNAYVCGGALAAQTGADVVEATDGEKILVPHFEAVEVKTNVATLTHVPVGTVGSEVLFAWKVNKDNSQGEKFEVDVSPSEGKFQVEASSKTLTFNEGDLQDGDRVYVLYDYEATSGRKITNTGDTFSATVRLLIDVLMRDACDQSVVYHGIIEYPNAKIDGNFSVEFGDEPSVHAFGAQALVDICSKDKTLWNWYLCE